MSQCSNHRSEVSIRLADKDKRHRVNKQTFPNKQISPGVVSDKRVNITGVCARCDDGGTTKCAIRRLTAASGGGSEARVTTAFDKSPSGSSLPAGGRQSKQTRKASRIDNRVSGDRLRSSRYENGGVCQVLAPANIDRSRKVRDHQTNVPVSRLLGLGPQRHRSDYHPAAWAIEKKLSASFGTEKKSVLCNITHSRNLLQSSNSSKVRKETQRKDCHPNGDVQCRLQRNFDANDLLNGNTSKSNRASCSFSFEHSGTINVTRDENGADLSPVGRSRSLDLQRDKSACKENTNGKKCSKKVFLKRTSGLVRSMESGEKTCRTDRDRRGKGQKRSKIAVLSKSSGQRKSSTQQKQSRLGTDINVFSSTDCQVVSDHCLKSTSLPGNSLKAEITARDRNGRDCEASRRREIGDEQRCASSERNIAGLSQGKVFHFPVGSVTGVGGDQGTNDVSISLNTNGCSEKATVADDTEESAPRAASVIQTRKICGKSIGDCVISSVNQHASQEVKLEHFKKDVQGSSVVADNTKQHYNTIAGSQSAVDIQVNNKTEISLHNGELTSLRDASAAQFRSPKPGTNSVRSNIQKHDHEYTKSIKYRETSACIHKENTTRLDCNECDQVKVFQGDDFRVSELESKATGDDDKANRRHRQMSGIPCYRKHGKASDVKKKNFLKSGKDITSINADSRVVRFGESGVKNGTDTASLPFIPGSKGTSGSKSLKRQVGCIISPQDKTESGSSSECDSSEDKVCNKTELLLISDHVSYLVRLPKRDACSLLEDIPSATNEAICKTSAGENLAEADAVKSLEVTAGTVFPKGCLSLSDKERKVGNITDKFLESSNSYDGYLPHSRGKTVRRVPCLDNDFLEGEFEDNNGIISDLIEDKLDFENSDTLSEVSECLGDINDDILQSVPGNGKGAARCVKDQSPIKSANDQEETMATTMSNPLREKNVLPSKHKGEKLKRQIGQASLDVSLTEKGEGSGVPLPDSVAAKKKQEDSTSRLMRPTISSAIRSSPEMAKKLIPKVRSPSSPERVFSPPVERRNKDHTKVSVSLKSKSTKAGEDRVAHKPPTGKLTGDKMANTSRSSLSSAETSVEVSSKSSEISCNRQKPRKSAKKMTTTTGHVSPKLQKSVKTDGSEEDKVQTEKLSAPDTEEKETCTVSNTMEQNKKIGKCSSEEKVLQHDNKYQNSSKQCDKKVEKTRKNVQAHENGESVLKANKEQEIHDKKCVPSKLVSQHQRPSKTSAGEGKEKVMKTTVLPGKHNDNLPASNKGKSETSIPVTKKNSDSIVTDMETSESESRKQSVNSGSQASSVGVKTANFKSELQKSSMNQDKRVQKDHKASSMAIASKVPKQKNMDNKSSMSDSEDFKRSKVKPVKSVSTVPKSDSEASRTTDAKVQRKNMVSSSAVRSDRSVSNSPRSSVSPHNDDTDSVTSVSSSSSKANKAQERKVKVSRLPSANNATNKPPSKIGKVKSHVGENSSKDLGPSTKKLTKHNISSDTDIKNTKDSICDLQSDSKPALKKKNLKENMNRKQRELSPLPRVPATEMSEQSMDENIPSISDYDTDKTEDPGPKTSGPERKNDQLQKNKQVPKSLTSPKVESRKIHQNRSHSKKSPTSPHLNKSPGSPKTESKKSPTSPSLSNKSVSTRLAKKCDTKLPKKSGIKTIPHRSGQGLRSLSLLEQRYTAEHLELMRLKIPADMDFSDVSRPSTREGSVDSRFDDDRWSVCSDLSSVSRASSVGRGTGIRQPITKVPTRMTGPRIKPPGAPNVKNGSTGCSSGPRGIDKPRDVKQSVGAKRDNSAVSNKTLLTDHVAKSKTVNKNRNDKGMLKSKIPSPVENLQGGVSNSLYSAEHEKSTEVITQDVSISSTDKGHCHEKLNSVLIGDNEQGCSYMLNRVTSVDVFSKMESSSQKISSDSVLLAEGSVLKDGNVIPTADKRRHSLQQELDTVSAGGGIREEVPSSPNVQVRENQDGQVSSSYLISEANLICEPPASLSDKQRLIRGMKSMETGPGITDAASSEAKDLQVEVTHGVKYSFSKRYGQVKQEPASTRQEASARKSELPREHCTQSPGVYIASSQGGLLDNRHRHHRGSENTNNKHLHDEGGGAQKELSHPSNFSGTPIRTDRRDQCGGSCEKEVINGVSDKGGLLGNCDGIFSKLSPVGKIKSEGRRDSRNSGPELHGAVEEADFSLTEEFMGQDKNEKEFGSQVDNSDKISINKLVHISGSSDKLTGNFTTKTAGTLSIHAASDSSSTQGKFDTSKHETEPVLAEAVKGGDGRVIRDMKSASSYSQERGKAPLGADGSDYSSGEPVFSAEGQTSKDTGAHSRQLEQTPKDSLFNEDSNDATNYDLCEKGEEGDRGESSSDLNINCDGLENISGRNMDSDLTTDAKLLDRRNGDAMEFTASEDTETPIINSDMLDQGKDMESSEKLETEKSSVIVISPGSQTANRNTLPASSSMMVSSKVKKTAGIQIHVSHNGVGHNLAGSEGNKLDKSPGKKCDSQTSGRIQSGKADKLSTRVPDRRLIIDKRNLHPENYNENMPIQRKIILSPDTDTVKSLASCAEVICTDVKTPDTVKSQDLPTRLPVTQTHNSRVHLTVSGSEPRKDGSNKVVSRIQTYKPVHKSELLKHSSVRKSLASRAQSKTVPARFSQDLGALKTNKLKESGIKSNVSEDEKVRLQDSTLMSLPCVSALEICAKDDKLGDVTEAGEDRDSSESSCVVSEEDVNVNNGENLEQVDYIISETNVNCLEINEQFDLNNSVDDRTYIQEVIVPIGSQTNNYAGGGDFTETSLRDGSHEEPVFPTSLPGKKHIEVTTQTKKDDTRPNENIKPGKSKLPPVVSPKPKISVTPDGKIDLTYTDICVKTSALDKSAQETDSSSQVRLEPGYTKMSTDFDVLNHESVGVSAVTHGGERESREADVELVLSSQQTDIIVNKSEAELATILEQTVVTSVAPPEQESIELCGFDKSPEISSPLCPTDTVSKQALKRSTATTSLLRWQSVRNKFLSNPMKKVSKEKINIGPSAYGSVEKTIEEFEECLDKTTDRGRAKTDEKLHETSRVLEIKKTLRERLTKSPVPETPPATPSPSPTRKYKWIRDGGIWKKKFLSDSGESGSEVEDYGKDDHKECVAKLLLVNRSNRSLDRESSSEKEYHPVKTSGRCLFRDIGHDTEMDTSASELDDWDDQYKSENQFVETCETYVTNDNICVETIEFEAVRSHFNRVSFSSGEENVQSSKNVDIQPDKLPGHDGQTTREDTNMTDMGNEMCHDVFMNTEQKQHIVIKTSEDSDTDYDNLEPGDDIPFADVISQNDVNITSIINIESSRLTSDLHPTTTSHIYYGDREDDKTEVDLEINRVTNTNRDMAEETDHANPASAHELTISNTSHPHLDVLQTEGMLDKDELVDPPSAIMFEEPGELGISVSYHDNFDQQSVSSVDNEEVNTVDEDRATSEDDFNEIITEDNERDERENERIQNVGDHFENSDDDETESECNTTLISDALTSEVCLPETDKSLSIQTGDKTSQENMFEVCEENNIEYTDKDGETLAETRALSDPVSLTINVKGEQDDTRDETAVEAEIQEKFVPIEASPILRKKFVEPNPLADHVVLSAAESLESVNVSGEPVSEEGFVTKGWQAEAVEQESTYGESLCSSYESGDAIYYDDDLDTTMTDEENNDDLCDLVINEELDDTVVGAEGGVMPMDLLTSGDTSHGDSDMDVTSQDLTDQIQESYIQSAIPEVQDPGYWYPRKAFWEKDSHELLAEISEIEESSDVVDTSSLSENEKFRSGSESPVKVAEQQGGTTPKKLRGKKSLRRSLSLPSGTLSYGDVKISYVDGHFVTEPPEQSPESPERDVCTKTHTVRISCTSSESIDGNSSEDTLSVVSDLAIRDELLSLLNHHLVDSDVFYNQSLDWNYNHLGSDSSAHSSQSSLGMMPASATLPRRTGRDNDGHRPVSVDDIQIFRNAYLQTQGHVNQGQSRTFRESVSQDIVSDPRNGRRRLSVQEDKSERSRSKSPNFFQRMLSKRKSFSDKGAKQTNEDMAPRKDTSIVRRMSLKSLFKRKVRKGSEESDGPPIATFLKNEDIGAVSSLPNSPFVSKRVQRIQTDPNIQVRRPGVNEDSQSSVTSQSQNQSITSSSSRVSLTRPDLPPRRRQSSTSSMKHSFHTDRSSGEYSICELDGSFEDTLTLSSSTSVTESDRDITLISSTSSGDSSISNQNRPIPRRDQMSPQEYEKLSGKLLPGEITASNSNDSGIQHDAVILSSCESLKVSPDTTGPVIGAVKLRKTPSPKQERPKSDITVRWADLLEHVKESDITIRADGQRIRKRPRPKSDLEDILFVDEGLEEEGDDDDDDDDNVDDVTKGGSTMLSDTMRTFGSFGNLRPSDSLRNVRVVDGFQVEIRRPGQEERVVSAKLVKSRRMSTPHPIKNRSERTTVSRSQPKVPVMVRSHSMPENLDKLHRKKSFFGLIASDSQSIYSQRSCGDDSSDESEYSVELTLHDKCPSTRSSQMALATLDETQEEETMTYAEALWDHVTMDPDELGFRAGDQIRVTDMLDKDWWFGCTEQHRGWFPAAFVRLWVNQERFEEDMVIQDTELPKIRNHGVNTNQGRANVVNEIIHAEREYVKHLRDVVEGYLKQARKRPEMFPEEKISIIFGNIEDIYNFATRFLSCLEKAFVSDAPYLSTIGQVFLLHSKCFEIYSDYCNNHPGSGEEVKELYRNKRYRHFFEACRLLQEMIEIPLEGFLLTPVQKICKYHLQLNELLKYTPPDHQDYSHAKAALESMKQIATLINERKRKMESIEKIAMWQASVDDWEGDDILQQSSELIYSGELNKINSSGWSQERYFFLFDHQLVYCKKDLLKKNSFCYKGRVDLDHSDVIPLSDGKDAQYNVTVRHAWKVHDTFRDKWYLLVAKSDQVKQRWLKAFEDERKRVKDDQENNFNIPLHVKQTAINNIRQKSHLSKPKGKRKAARSTSLRHTKKPESVVPMQTTLPRRKQQDSLGDINQSKKLQWFFLGQGKKK